MTSVNLDNPRFQGETFDVTMDGPRLKGQLDRVRSLMLWRSAAETGGGWWWTLHEISEMLGYPEASISARLRQLRHEGLIVERRRLGRGGLWEYRVSQPGQAS